MIIYRRLGIVAQEFRRRITRQFTFTGNVAYSKVQKNFTA